MSKTSAATGAGEIEANLRFCASKTDGEPGISRVTQSSLLEAADALAALREENSRLRKALAHYQCTCTTQCAHGMPVDMCGWEARAALSEKPAAEKEVGADSRDPMEDSQWWDDSDMGAR